MVSIAVEARDDDPITVIGDDGRGGDGSGLDRLGVHVDGRPGPARGP